MFRRLYRDENGATMLLFTIMLPVLMGMVGLALEANRVFMAHSELQNMADAAALAGANQLDGSADSITNARAAALNFSNNNGIGWADGAFSSTYQINAPLVLDNLDDTTESTTPATARYVKVTAQDRSIAPMFLVATGAVSNSTVSATATAQSFYVACNVQPMMLCNPFEPSDTEFRAAVDAGTVKPGMQFHMKVLNDPGSGGSNQSFAPGDFGLLDPPGLNSSGAPKIRDLLSQQDPKFCYIDNVSPRTGQAVQKVNDGINVRFDIPVNGTNNDPDIDLSTAPVVIKGYQPQANYCQNGNFDDQPTWRLPRDSGTPTTYGNMTIGSGAIDSGTISAYMTAHFGGAPWRGGTAAGQPNRYNQYVAEQTLTNQGIEPKAPVCQPTSSAGANRRIISVAVVDCIANGVKGNSTTNVRSTAYADLFITEPSTNGELWGEFVRLMTPTADGTKLHHIVNLVRDY